MIALRLIGVPCLAIASLFMMKYTTVDYDARLTVHSRREGTKTTHTASAAFEAKIQTQWPVDATLASVNYTYKFHS